MKLTRSGVQQWLRVVYVLGLAVSAVALPATPSFEKNVGQAQSPAEFLLHLNRANLLLGSTTMEYRLPSSGEARWEWVGAATGHWEGLEATGDTTVYCLGSDSSRWTQPAPGYRRLIRRNLYPNIDEMAYLHNGAFEYDLILRPGADPSKVLLKTTGASPGADGELRVTLPGGAVIQSPPRTYQIVEGLRVMAEARFVAAGDGLYRLDMGSYDPGLSLVVDPVINTVLAVLGGDDDRVVASTATLTVGVTRSADWDRPPGSNSDLFFRFRVGDTLRTVFWGGDGDDEALGFSPGVDGYPVVVGRTSSKNLPIIETFGIRSQSTYGGGESDGFMVGLERDHIRFSTYVGGRGRDSLNSVGVNATTGNTLFVAAGETDSTGGFDVPAALGGRGAIDALIVRVSSRGIEAITIGGSGDDRATAIAVAPDGTLAIAGDSNSDDFSIPGGSPLQRTGGADAWFVLLQWDDTPQFLSSSMWGGVKDERVGGAAYSADGSLYLAGTTSSSDYPLLNPAQAQFGGGASDGFIARFDAAGNRITSTYLGGPGRDELLAATARGSDLLVAGFTDSPDLAGTAAGGTDGLFAQVDPKGRVVWATRMGGPTDDRLLNVQTLASGEVRVSGWTQSREWLAGLGPSEFLNGAAAQPGTTDGFAATLSYSYVTALDQVIGKDLQVPLPLSIFSAAGSDGIVSVRSADPSKLLVSTSPVSAGSDRVVLFFADQGNSSLYLQALDSTGDVEVILSGQYFPERRVTVHLLPSAIFSPQNSYTVSATQSYITVPLFVAPVNAATGGALAPQSVRGGLDSQITLTSSDESGLRPGNRTSADPLFYFNILRAGSYTLTPSSPVFASGGPITVQGGVSSLSTPRFWMAKDGRITFPMAAMFSGHQRLISEDPSKIVMSFPIGADPAGTLDVTGAPTVYLDALADSGTVAVRIEGDDGSQNRVLIALTGAHVSVTPASSILTSGDTAQVRMTLTPVGTAPAGFTVPVQWIRANAAFGILSIDAQFVQVTNIVFDYANPAWVVWLRALRTGSTDIEFLTTDTTNSHSNVHFEIKPNHISFGRPTLDIPEGLSLNLRPVAIAGQTLQAVQLSVKDPGVALIQYTGPPVGSTTVNLLSYGVLLTARGKAGQKTSITVSAAGVEPFDLPVRIVRPVLAPSAQEYWINGAGNVPYGIFPLDPDTGQPEDAVTYQDGVNPLPVTVQSTSDVCRFSKQIETYSPYSPQYILPATCPSAGEAMLQVQAANLGTASAVHIISGPSGARTGAYGEPFPKRAFTGDGVQTPIEIPYGFQSEITLTSDDPSKLLLSLSENEPGRESVITSRLGRVWLQGFASEGMVTITATGASVGRSVITVFLMHPAIAVTAPGYAQSGQHELQVTESNGVIYLNAQPSLVDPATGEWFAPAAMTLRWDHDPFLAMVHSSNTAVLEPQAPTPIFSGGSSSQQVALRTKSPGTAELTAVQPPGFVPPAPFRVRVIRPGLKTQDRVLVGKDMQTALTVTATNGRLPDGVAVTAVSLNPDKLLVANSVLATGQATTTSSGNGELYVQGLAAGGSAQVRLQAAGYDDALVTVDLLPVSLFAQVSPSSLAPLRTAYMWLGFRLLNGSPDGIDTGLRGGVTVPVNIRSLDETIVLPAPNGALTLKAGQGPLSIQLNALRPGDTSVVLEAPSGISLPSAQFPIHVSNWGFFASGAGTLGRALMAPMTITNGRPQTITAVVASSGGDPVLISPGNSTPGQPSIEVSIGGLSSTSVWVEGGRQGSNAAVTISAPEFDPATFKFQLVDPLAIIGIIPDLQANGAKVNVPVQLTAGMYGPVEALGASQDPITLNVRSSDPSIVQVGAASLLFKPGESIRPLALQPGKAGTAIITLQGPAYLNPPSGARDYLITVR